MNTVQSSVPRVLWPAVPGPVPARLLAMGFQLEQSQWWSPGEIQGQQRRQLGQLLDHARTTVPFYRQRLAAAGHDANPSPSDAFWHGLPLLSREDIQEAGQALVSEAIPTAHGHHRWLQTSGSTGRPIRALVTGLTGLFWNALVLREHHWHRRDFSRRLCALRAEAVDNAPDGADGPDWGHPVSTVYRSGPASLMGIHQPVERQARWLMERQPGYLLTHPSNLRALARHFVDAGLKLPGLVQARTYGETVTDELRALVRAAWGVPLVDAYSAQEVGYIALQCPQHDHYHVQSESLLVEVLDDDGRPCVPGEVGRVAMTTLHNFAMPLIRYVNQDYAEVGPPCPCGRGLPVLRRILGRRRNMLTLPDGRRFWPSFPAHLFTEVADIRQFQLIQDGPAHLELRLVAPGGLTPAQREELARRIVSRFGHPFEFRFELVDAIPQGPGHKYEDFISRVGD